MYRDHTTCRACGNPKLIPVANFGVQPLANDFRRPGEPKAGRYPLSVMFCDQCTLAQLSVVVDPKTLYANYSYVTSPSKTMVAHFEALSHYAHEFRHGDNLGRVLEIGSNNGAFLKWLQDWKFADRVYGVDPALNLTDHAPVPTLCALWSEETASMLSNTFDTIFARHVFAHCDDWKGFVRGLELVSHGNGTVFIEVPSARTTLDRGEFDQIYHEHLSYVTEESMHALLEGTQFYIHDAKEFDVHGGSVVYVLKHRGKPPDQIFYARGETPVTALDWSALQETARICSEELLSTLIALRIAHKRIFGFGATAKATLLSSMAALSTFDLDFVHDDTPQKQGTFLPGTDIPVIDGTERMKEMDVCLILAWNFEREIREKLAWFAAKGGTFVVPTQLKQE